MRLLLIDHLDSFSQTLAADCRALGAEVNLLTRGRGVSLDPKTLADALCSSDAVILSPGPGHPAEYRQTCPLTLLSETHPDRPVFGVCLGLQQLLSFSGATIEQLEDKPIHGRVGPLSAEKNLPPPFTGIPANTPVVSYNSLGATRAGMATASEEWVTVYSTRNPQSVNLACHRERPWAGVQFHPESFATPGGTEFLRHFLTWARDREIGCTTSLSTRSTLP